MYVNGCRHSPTGLPSTSSLCQSWSEWSWVCLLDTFTCFWFLVFYFIKFLAVCTSLLICNCSWLTIICVPQTHWSDIGFNGHKSPVYCHWKSGNPSLKVQQTISQYRPIFFTLSFFNWTWIIVCHMPLKIMPTWVLNFNLESVVILETLNLVRSVGSEGFMSGLVLS